MIATERVLVLPELLACDRGMFAARGLDVVPYLGDTSGVEAALADDVPLSFALAFEEEELASPCERRLLRRIGSLLGAGPMLYSGGVVASYALVAVADEVAQVADIAGQPIGVVAARGATCAAESFLRWTAAVQRSTVLRSAIAPDLLDQLYEGSVAAVVVPEPYISRALADGAHVVASTTYRGTVALEPSIPELQRRAFLDAVNEAVDLLREDPALADDLLGSGARGLARAGLGHAFLRVAQARVLPAAGQISRPHARLQPAGR